MNETRERILGRLRRASATPAVAPLARAIERFDWSREQRLRQFAERLRAVRAEVHRSRRDEWPQLLMRLALAKGIGNILLAPETAHGEALASVLRDSPIAPLSYPGEIESCKDWLFGQVESALTGSRGAIAETGSLILWPDRQEPRLMSLVPPIHFVFLEAERIYSSFAEALEAQDWAAGMPSNALLISGPSKSADIAQVLAYGVHGPKELLVLVVE